MARRGVIGDAEVLRRPAIGFGAILDCFAIILASSVLGVAVPAIRASRTTTSLNKATAVSET